MVCNVVIILMTALNALDRPRDSGTKLAAVLAQDGLFYFVGITSENILEALPLLVLIARGSPGSRKRIDDCDSTRTSPLYMRQL